MEYSSALYEREAEIDALAGLVTRARSGRGGFAAVEGLPGIGKSSLLAAVHAVARSHDLWVATARGMELESDFAFGVVRQLFEPLLAGSDPQQRRQLLSGAAGQADPVFGPVTTGDSAEHDFAVLHGLLWLTTNLSEQRPLMLLVDDMHWADVASLQFLAYLLPRLDALGVCVVAALRRGEPGSGRQLLERITTDRACLLLRPRALSPAAAFSLVRGEFARGSPAEQVDDEFLAACHSATGGNPLLLKETVATLMLERVAPQVGNVGQVAEVGPRAAARWVSLWTRRLTPAALALARAVAVLGDGVSLEQAAALAELPLTTAMQAGADLRRIDLLRAEPGPGSRPGIGYTHPVVRAAVYQAMAPEETWAAHRRAAELLFEDGAEAEQVAAHLLRSPPTGQPHLVPLLTRAAHEARTRGSPHAAATYLQRCLGEASGDDDRLAVLSELGLTLQLTDTEASVRYLRQALPLARDGRRHAMIASLLGTGLLLTQRIPEALDVWRHALAQLPPDEADLTARLQADILSIPLLEPAGPGLRQDILRQVGRQRQRQPGLAPTPGGRILDCVIAGHDAIVGDPRAVPRALRALEDSRLLGKAVGVTPAVLAWWVLICADRPEALTSLDLAVTQAYHEGSTASLTSALTYRALAWLRRGSLAEAEADALDAVSATETSGISLHRLVLGPIWAEVLMEQGRLPEAEKALEWALEGDTLPLTGLIYHLLLRRARLLRLLGDIGGALETALAAGEAFMAAGGQNPAVLPWQSEAALCLHLLDRDAEAQVLALEELRLTRDWSAPLARGRALRVAGLVHRGEPGTTFLEQAVQRLESTQARLEYAKAAAEYGASLRRGGQRTDSRRVLTEALDVARTCGATALMEQVLAELKAGGGRPRRHMVSGSESLTPSEIRVAELAAAGRSNREIAQTLFVTPKTVEAHLASSYRKLGITSRRQLADQLPPPTST
ncbi:DNA-binding CsgD family transcriptional regulator [Kitasatospora sp. MAA4]|uniref:helix-turn-helix transcriptional regulator n=1 Tax=Kitasatospora sp. MAA4 TaxID=3035093 RepID=UPI0024761A3B|nr:AAA family ATPase [Kitasatospora sp. MAA4]MDH6137589.1 DNA-binding CsgD family transcriptional regulator [Kitasatospora sp. MAA4]